MIKTIIFATDFLSLSNKVFKYVFDLKEKYQAKLIVLNINETFVNKDEMIMSRVGIDEIKKSNEGIALNNKKMFKNMMLSANVEYSSDIKMVQRQGVASQEIIQYAESINSDLIVIGSNNHSKISELFIGSTARKVINNSKIPILVVPA